MEKSNIYPTCKYCDQEIAPVTAEGLRCTDCLKFVHTNCLIKGTVPGGLKGDIFFQFTCQTCSLCGTETFVRDKMTWFQAITISLYQMTMKSPALARKGYFHWKTHIVTFIDKNWDMLFPKEFKRKKKWMGTVSGTLSVYSPHFFTSGTSVFKEPGWWTLAYPKLTPGVTVQLNTEFTLAKQKAKERKMFCDDQTILKQILESKNFPEEYLLPIAYIETTVVSNDIIPVPTKVVKQQPVKVKIKPESRKHLLPTLDNLQEAPQNKLFKKYDETVSEKDVKHHIANINTNNSSSPMSQETDNPPEDFHKILPKMIDPFCHYNTSLRDISQEADLDLKFKLLGGIREELLYSPYSGLFLKPYIRRDTTVVPQWLKVLEEILLKSNQKKSDWKLPCRSSLDYAYVQPEHIPAINSLCNQFFWPGVDLTECLQYPDFSCVVLYRKLIVAFGFVVPDVKFNEAYISFIFTRPGWRNVGIAKFMLYHLTQTCSGKDLTLHVSINNPALFLYQKFGFKVERVVLDFYDKYFRKDTNDSKHAYFCRLER